jgi:hypothetical protein
LPGNILRGRQGIANAANPFEAHGYKDQHAEIKEG